MIGKVNHSDGLLVNANSSEDLLFFVKELSMAYMRL